MSKSTLGVAMLLTGDFVQDLRVMTKKLINKNQECDHPKILVSEDTWGELIQNLSGILSYPDAVHLLKILHNFL
jgi:hypothetical protein